MNGELCLYLAGPDVFEPDAAARFAAMKDICRRHGAVGLSPLDGDVGAVDEQARALGIFDSNLAMIRACDAVIANLTPFRGPSSDVGTALEVGLACALNKPVFGYSRTADLYHEKVSNLSAMDAEGFADDGFLVENFGLTDNLMILGAIERSGGSLILGDEPFSALGSKSTLDLFERCVIAAAAAFGGRSIAPRRVGSRRYP